MKRTPESLFLLGAFVLTLAACFTACRSTTTRTTVELSQLQGHWEGDGREGNGPGFKCSITITGNALRCFRDTNYWFETAFTLPAGAGPQQLRATLKDSSHRSHIGAAVVAIVKIEGGTLTLAASDHGETPKHFETESDSIFVLRKVPPQKKNSKPLEAR